jgi:hypothetical protein
MRAYLPLLVLFAVACPMPEEDDDKGDTADDTGDFPGTDTDTHSDTETDTDVDTDGDTDTDVDTDVDTDTTAPDNDGDGYSEFEDCDDTDASVNPGAADVCNGIDDNCDGRVDEGVGAIYYFDADGDGHGDPANVIEACAPPEGYVSMGDDCDDADPYVNPSAVEECGSDVDNNCDGMLTEC